MCSMCWMFAVHSVPVRSLKREAMCFAVSSAQACHTSLSAFLPETFWMASLAAVFCNGEVMFWCMCKTPPVVPLSSRQATGQPSSELGMRPRFTRSATSHSWSWKSKSQTKRDVSKNLYNISLSLLAIKVI